MSEQSGDERNLLRYYAETERIIHGSVRGAVHQHLLGMVIVTRQNLAQLISRLQQFERGEL